MDILLIHYPSDVGRDVWAMRVEDECKMDGLKWSVTKEGRVKRYSNRNEKKLEVLEKKSILLEDLNYMETSFGSYYL
jgi:hypothetical protein